MSDETRAAAHWYADKGWRVIPTSGALKHPVIDEWQLFATKEHEAIDKLFDETPPSAQGVAIATGEESGVFVLDVDPRDGGDETLRDLTELNGSLPETPMSITGSGGLHYFFRYPDGVKILNSASKLGPGLDIRGNGGQVSAPPTIHKTGRPYQWEIEHDPADMELADAPQWLLDLITASQIEEEPRRERRERVVGEMLPGDRFNAETEWADLLDEVGAKFMGSRDGEEFWSRPPRPGEDFEPHTGATLYYKGSDVLKVFTPNWPPLEAGATYDKLGFYAEYNFLAPTHEEKVALAIAFLSKEQLNAEWDPWFNELSEIIQKEDRVREEKEEADSGWVAQSLTEARKLPPPPPPDVLCRTDGVFALYRGKLHFMYGPPESGKSWAAQLATVQVVNETPGRVLYIDFENDIYSFLERMDALGLDTGCEERITYVAPSLNWSEAAERSVQRYLSEHPALIVIDGTSNALGLFGIDPQSNAGLVEWEIKFTRSLTRSGAAVVMIDHAPKNAETPSIFGAQHKMAMVTGATYYFKTVKPFGRDMSGMARMTVQKDKPGYLRRHGLNEGYFADLIIDDTGARMEARLEPPNIDNVEGDFIPEYIMEKLARTIWDHPGLSDFEIYAMVAAKDAWMRAGLRKLKSDGFVKDDLGSGRLYAVKPFGGPELLDQMQQEELQKKRLSSSDRTEQSMGFLQKRTRELLPPDDEETRPAPLPSHEQAQERLSALQTDSGYQEAMGRLKTASAALSSPVDNPVASVDDVAAPSPSVEHGASPDILVAATGGGLASDSTGDSSTSDSVAVGDEPGRRPGEELPSPPFFERVTANEEDELDFEDFDPDDFEDYG